MRIVTHNGYFHTDDLLAVATLLIKYPEAEVIRSRDEDIINSADIVVDVGRVYDPLKQRFDHHQKEGAGVRESGIPYASLGLVWKEFGEELSGGQREAQVVDDKLVAPIDASDNGISIVTSLFSGITPYSVEDFLDMYNDGADSLEDFDSRFSVALPYATQILKGEINRAKSLVSDWDEVQTIYDKSDDKNIIVLPLNKHWKRVLIPTEAKFVVLPRPDGQWSARAIPVVVGDYKTKVPFPESWGGLSAEQLAEVSGVVDATFCHRDRWLANAKTREGAINLAKKALEQ